ncbi:hypothetical protein, partial [Acidithiobacillus sp.]|uniref:hypothetical protein n=1 Tax=Acidithiobacillus sp. TaxID=1872118 RepID=UPI003D014A20
MWGAGGFYFAVSANGGEYCWWSTFSLSQMKRCKDQGLNVLAVFNPTMPGEDLTQLHVYGFNPVVILENLHQHRGVIMRAQLMRAVNVVDDNTSEIAGEISRLMEPMCNPNRLTESDIDALHTQAIRILRGRRFTGSESGAASKLKQALDAVLVRIRPTEDGRFRLFADKGDLTLETLESGSLRFATIVLNELEKQIVQQARQTCHTPVVDPGCV